MLNFIQICTIGSEIEHVNQHYLPIMLYFMHSAQGIHDLRRTPNYIVMCKPDKQTEAAVSGQLAFCLLSLAYLSYQPAFFLKLLQLAVTLTCYKEQGWCLVPCVHNGKLVEPAERNLLQQQQVSLPEVHLLKHRKLK